MLIQRTCQSRIGRMMSACSMLQASVDHESAYSSPKVLCLVSIVVHPLGTVKQVVHILGL